MKKITIYVISGILVVSLAGNIYQYTAAQKQAAEVNANIASIQTRLENTAKELTEAKDAFSKMELDYTTLQADYATLEQVKATTVLQTATNEPVKPPVSSKPDGNIQKPVEIPIPKPPVTPPASASEDDVGFGIDDILNWSDSQPDLTQEEKDAFDQNINKPMAPMN